MENDINKIKEDIEHIICSNNEHSNLIIDINSYSDDIIEIIIKSKDAFKIKPIIKYLKNNKFYIKKLTLPENSPIKFVTNYIITGTFHKNLLIVGNGFDLAHKFKTSYTDFLNCFNVDDTVYINSTSYNMTNNAFYKYLNNIKNKRGYWIDVETAISDIVKYVEKIKKGFIFIEDKTYSSKELNTLFGEECSQFIDIFSPQIYIEGSTCDYKITIESFNTALKKLEYDLDSFTKALEDYLIMIEEQDISSEKIILTDIKNIQEKITHILSFNYTNTFKILYTDDISNEYIDFIHGRLGKHNLVLGISETLPTEEENIELSCIYFKKYFQRIFKKTGAKYADWLDDKNGTNFDTVYIYGHSLDITDKEILSRIINDVDHVKKIVIFYHNETHYRQEISNLVKILDKNTFLKYVAEHRIEFKEQTSYLNL